MAAQIGAPAAARAHQELFAYWASLRRGTRLPGRRDIHPEGFKRLLPTISLTDVLPGRADYRLRLAGTALHGVYGREITGRRLRLSAESQDQLGRALGLILGDGIRLETFHTPPGRLDQLLRPSAVPVAQGEPCDAS